MLRSPDPNASHRYLFVGGLHRSGTSLTARLVGSLEGVAQIRDAPVPENEGAYLQGGIPHDALSGRPMHFATDPAQHMTERHPLNRLDTRERMEADWAPWFEPAPWRVEKSPVNLTRMRLLQQLFPLSQFVIVIRHPEAVACAVAKWVDRPFSDLVDHWLDAHDLVADDLRRLHSIVVVRYEDIVARPDRIRAALSRFLALPKPGSVVAEVIRDGNVDYRPGIGMTRSQVERAATWGYGSNLWVDPDWSAIVRHPLRAIREAVRAELSE